MENQSQDSQQKKSSNPETETDILSSLPVDVISEVLSRLPVQATVRFTALNKTFLNMIKSREFAKLHYFKTTSKAALFLLGGPIQRPYRIIGFTTDANANAKAEEKINAPNCRKIFDFNFPFEQPLYAAGSDGLLFLCTQGMIGANNVRDNERALWPRDLFICSPMIAQYMKIPVPAELSSSAPQVHIDTFGFGLSNSGKYKLARVFHANSLLSEANCQVYTLGGGWGQISVAGAVKYDAKTKGASLNGRIYWLVKRDNTPLISCFDLDKETFSTFSPPPLSGDFEGHLCLSVLGEELCFTDNSHPNDIAIWLRKEEGRGEGKVQSWTKAYTIRGKNLALDENILWPIHVFKNGDMFLAVEVEHRLYFYSKSMGIMQGFHPLEMEAKAGDDLSYWFNGTIATNNFKQSYVPLEAFVPAEEVYSFAPL